MLVKYIFADGTVSEVEVNEEVGNFIMDSRREEANLDRKERYHCVSLNSACFEGSDYSDSKTVENIINMLETEKHMNVFWETLTETQRRRLEMMCSGMSSREIACVECVDHNAILSSIRCIQKKFLKIFEKDTSQNGL